MSYTLELSKKPYIIQKFPSVFQSYTNLESIKKVDIFNIFFNLVKEHHLHQNPQDSQSIIKRIKSKIFPMISLDELKILHEKCLNQPQKSREDKQFKWNFPHINLLVWIICEYCFILHIDDDSFSEADWKFIASLFPQISWEQCRFKWYSLQKSVIQKENWTEEENERLMDTIGKHKEKYPSYKRIKWSKIAFEFNKGKVEKGLYRLGKHCRERWLNHLNPNLTKKKWSLEEDLFILERIKDFGKKWSYIAKNLKGRHENGVKNRYISIKKSLRKTNEHINFDDINELLRAFEETHTEIEIIKKKWKNQSISCDNTPSLKNSKETLFPKNMINLSNIEFQNFNIPNIYNKYHHQPENKVFTSIFDSESINEKEQSLSSLAQNNKIFKEEDLACLSDQTDRYLIESTKILGGNSSKEKNISSYNLLFNIEEFINNNDIDQEEENYFST